MRAFQVVEFAAPIVARDLPDPQPQAGEVLVEVASCGLCHTDAHIQQGHFNLGGDQKLRFSSAPPRLASSEPSRSASPNPANTHAPSVLIGERMAELRPH